ncbi:MAG: hypothetical protein O2877_02250 [bacterium]|nr:hypothetical protein [bacterium]
MKILCLAGASALQIVAIAVPTAGGNVHVHDERFNAEEAPSSTECEWIQSMLLQEPDLIIIEDCGSYGMLRVAELTEAFRHRTLLVYADGAMSYDKRVVYELLEVRSFSTIRNLADHLFRLVPRRLPPRMLSAPTSPIRASA